MNEAVSVHCKVISLTWVMRNTFLEEVVPELRAKLMEQKLSRHKGKEDCPPEGAECA